MGDEEWRRTLSINLDSVFTAINHLGPAMACNHDLRYEPEFGELCGKISHALRGAHE